MDPKNFLSLDSLLTDRVRLAIMATLCAAEEPLDFASLLDNLELSKGNLSSHMRKLDDAGLVSIKKEFVGRKPKTTYCATEAGRAELKRYLDVLSNLIKETRQ